jgi:hypothetical protein
MNLIFLTEVKHSSSTHIIHTYVIVNYASNIKITWPSFLLKLLLNN